MYLHTYIAYIYIHICTYIHMYIHTYTASESEFASL
jgi:hypothetical protein